MTQLGLSSIPTRFAKYYRFDKGSGDLGDVDSNRIIAVGGINIGDDTLTASEVGNWWNAENKAGTDFYVATEPSLVLLTSAAKFNGWCLTQSPLPVDPRAMDNQVQSNIEPSRLIVTQASG